jgi:hypothetical protein
MKQSVSFVRMNVNKKVIVKEEFPCEQNTFRLPSYWANEAEAKPELVAMRNLKRASPIVYMAEIDDRPRREDRHVIETTNRAILSLVEIIKMSLLETRVACIYSSITKDNIEGSIV